MQLGLFDCLINLSFDFQEEFKAFKAFKAFKFKSYFEIPKFTIGDNIPEDVLPVNFNKVVALRIWADGNFL